MIDNNILVMTTTGSKEEATKLANTLVERRLAACVNIIPQIRSVYRWNDKVEHADEFLLLIKTYGTALERVRSLNREMNSYELPECISFKIDGGCSAYLKWLGNAVE
jgi:periplasmic divalent cation tolerance protein